MSTYRPGQRVRIEWPDDDAAMEGRLIAMPDVYYALENLPGDCVITILSEPRPDEPTGLGAVVEAACCHDKLLRRLWLRMEEGFWVSAGWSGTPEYKEASDEWDDLIDPVVLSEGWNADE